jgi:enamine deaminase RidA (YjgF/YER057c/UK114 family)
LNTPSAAPHPAQPPKEPVLSVHRQLLPSGWPKPKGYSNGVIAEGRTIYVGGQIGWDTDGRFPSGFIAQVEQALRNVVAVLAEGEAGPQHLVRLTWYVTDMDAYTGALKEVGRVYREVIGATYPPMSLLQVTRLVESQALVEIEATAVVGD